MREKLLRSIGWLAVRYGFRQGANTALFFAFAALLTPVEFGVGSIAIASGLLARQFLERGFRDVIIQNSACEPVLSDTAWMASAISGCLVAGLLFVTAPAFASLLGLPDLIPLLRLCSVIPLVAGMTTVVEGRVERDFRQKTLAVSQVGASMLSLAIGVWLAWNGYGAWAIVFSAVVEMVAAAALIFSIARWRPGFQIEWAEMWRQIRFAWPLMLSAVAGGGSFRIAQIIIGILLGAAATAQFRVGMQIYMLIAQLICAPLIVMLLPLFSQARDRVNAQFSDALSFYAVISLPVFLGAAAVSPTLIDVVLGADWSVAADLSRVFGFIVFTFLATDVLLPALIVKNAPGMAAFVQISGVSAGLILMSIGALFGLEAAVWGYVLRAIYSVPLSIVLARRYLGISEGQLRRRMLPYVLCAGGVFVSAVVSLDLLGKLGLSSAFALIWVICGGVVFYTALVRWGVKAISPAAYAPLTRHAPPAIARLL